MGDGICAGDPLSSTDNLQQQLSESLQVFLSLLVYLHTAQHECSITHRVSKFLEDLLANVTVFSPSENANIHRQKLQEG